MISVISQNLYGFQYKINPQEFTGLPTESDYENDDEALSQFEVPEIIKINLYNSVSHGFNLRCYETIKPFIKIILPPPDQKLN